VRAVVQRVSRAQVSVGEEVVGKIDAGLLVLVGVSKDDSSADAEYLAAKVVGLRIFEDENGKMNRSLVEIGGAVLAVSPQVANELYELFVRNIRDASVRCETGRFQAMMKVELVNDGPVTILLDSKKAF
jgi:D-tyrosyl-tRNA(Tyr) deacylase